MSNRGPDLMHGGFTWRITILAPALAAWWEKGFKPVIWIKWELKWPGDLQQTGERGFEWFLSGGSAVSRHIRFGT